MITWTVKYQGKAYVIYIRWLNLKGWFELLYWEMDKEPKEGDYILKKVYHPAKKELS